MASGITTTTTTTTNSTLSSSNSQVLSIYTITIQSLLPWLPNDLIPTSFSSSNIESSDILISSRPSKELRLVALSLNRLHSALSYANTNSFSLFSDQGSTTDIRIVLQELNEIAIRARQNRNTRPRIRVERRLTKDRQDQFSTDERKRIEILANRIDTLVQVALWKSSNSNQSNHLIRQSSCHNPQFVAVKRGRIGLGRARIGRRGRVFSNSEMGRRILSNHHSSHSQQQQNQPLSTSIISDPLSFSYQRHSSGRIIGSFKNSSSHSDHYEKRSSARDSSNSISSSTDLINSSSISTMNFASVFQYPWEFSLIENPITPLRSRTLSTANDGSIVMAMWKSQRVSVQIIRRDQERFYNQGEYLYKLGQSPNIPSLLGGHWENAITKSTKSKSSRKLHNLSNDNDGNVGFLITEVTNGTSLDKLVRDRKLSDTVTQIRILDHIVSALLFAQNINPQFSHQDLHPGNILLVPNIDSSSSSLSIESSSSITMDTPSLHENRNQSDEISSHILRSKNEKRKNKIFSLPYHHHQKNGDEISNKSSKSQKKDSTNPFPSSSSTTLTNTTTTAKEGKPSLSSSTSSLSKNQNNTLERPQLPKIEEVDEALTVLQRVALHDKIDEVANIDAATIIEKRSTNVTRNVVKSRTESINAAEQQEFSNHKSLKSSSRILPRHQQGSKQSYGKTIHQQLPSSPTPKPLVILDDHQLRKEYLSKNSINLLSSFTVKVMDFPAYYEADSVRTKMSLSQSEQLSGYCSPERVTSTMWRRIVQKREKEKEHERGKRIYGSRSSSNGPGSPRQSSRRSSNNGSGSGYITTRSGSNSNRAPFDSETYALFGDDPMNDHHDVIDSEMISNGYETRRKSKQNRPYDSHNLSNGFDNKSLLPYSSEDHDSKILIRTSDISETESGSHGLDRPVSSKVDVWSIGWILYYMSTGRHPSSDAWAKKNPLSDREMKEIPRECREIIQMCIQQDTTKQAELYDVKRKVDRVLHRLMFAKGLSLLETDKEFAFSLLDRAVGIKTLKPKSTNEKSLMSPTSSPVTPIPTGNGFNVPSTTISNGQARSIEDGIDQHAQYIGLNQRTRNALIALPLVVVRRVEWEAAARYLGYSNEDISRLQAILVDQKWNKRDVIDGHIAMNYLKKRSDEGIAAAQSALGWVYRWGAGGIKVNVHEAMNQWEKAIETNDPEACNGMGLLYHYGRDDIQVDGEKARKYYQRAVDLGHPAAAVNLGVMLHDGAAGLPADGVAARGLYEMACRHGNAIAANNLGLLLQHGGAGVEQDCASAVRAYELAIEMNERHHACRNLGELLWIGAPNVPRSRANAIEYFAQAMTKGDSSSRTMACERLKKLVKKAMESDDDEIPTALIDRCNRLLATGSMS